MRYEELTIEGRNAVLEAFRSGKTIDKLFVQDGCKDGPILSITREARKHDTLIKYVTKERMDQLSETGKHQGVIAYAAAYEYAEVEDILKNAREKGEEPFIFLLDNIEDPQPGSNHPYGKSGRGSRSHHSQKKSGRPYRYRGKNLCRGTELYAGGKGDKSGCNDRRTEKRRPLVRLCGYGRREHVPSESEGSHWPGDRKRRRGCQPSGKREVRLHCFHSHER